MVLPRNAVSYDCYKPLLQCPPRLHDLPCNLNTNKQVVLQCFQAMNAMNFIFFFFQQSCKYSAMEIQTGTSMCGSMVLSTDNGHW